jgi:hypothetical protein
MADTTKIKTLIEPYVRKWLSNQFPGHVFEKKSVKLASGGRHRFDAVAEDGSFVAAILSNRAHTRTHRENTGGVRKALTDLSYLQGLPASVQKIMVFTDHSFCHLIRLRASRLVRAPVQMMVCTLPPHLETLLGEILDDASHEQRAAGEN